MQLTCPCIYLSLLDFIYFSKFYVFVVHVLKKCLQKEKENIFWLFLRPK